MSKSDDLLVYGAQVAAKWREVVRSRDEEIARLRGLLAEARLSEDLSPMMIARIDAALEGKK